MYSLLQQSKATVEAEEVNSFKRLLDGEKLTRIDLFMD